MRLLSGFWVLGFLFSISPVFAASIHWNETLWNPAQKVQLHPSALDELAAAPAIFVLGEEHYNPPVQKAEAWLIDRLASQLAKSQPLIFGWEFLNTIDRMTIHDSYSRYERQEISSEELLQQLFPAGPASTEYIPVLETARRHEAQLIPTNLSRVQKNPVTREGIEALDPLLLPPDFSLGGPLYWMRFQEAMGPHPLPYPIENYFAAQSLTDEVMATELLKGPDSSLRVLITGAFHGDYRDGVVASLERRAKGLPLVYIRIIDASMMTKEELLAFMVHPQYGPIADLLYVVNEPRNARRKALPKGKAFH
jgi:uncharacterized iron-regulated protein